MPKKTFKEILEGKIKQTGKAIKTASAKLARRDKIAEFVVKYGRGDIGLSAEQKMSRIEKFIGKLEEINKVKGIGDNKSIGIDIFDKGKMTKLKTKDIEHDGEWDPIEKDVIDNIEQYPRDYRGDEDLRIIYINVRDDGSIEIELIHNNDKKYDHKTRQLSGVLIMNDEESARNEILQFKKNELLEVSDRTMIIHAREEVLDLLLEADDVDTDEDKYLQI